MKNRHVTLIDAAWLCPTVEGVPNKILLAVSLNVSVPLSVGLHSLTVENFLHILRPIGCRITEYPLD